MHGPPNTGHSGGFPEYSLRIARSVFRATSPCRHPSIQISQAVAANASGSTAATRCVMWDPPTRHDDAPNKRLGARRAACPPGFHPFADNPPGPVPRQLLYGGRSPSAAVDLA